MPLVSSRSFTRRPVLLNPRVQLIGFDGYVTALSNRRRPGRSLASQASIPTSDRLMLDTLNPPGSTDACASSAPAPPGSAGGPGEFLWVRWSAYRSRDTTTAGLANHPGELAYSAGKAWGELQ
jgi:hypothetical protein